MALTTRALVLQRLGMTDDSSAKPAIFVASGVSVTLTVSATTLSLSPTLNGPYTFANANADTLADIVTLLSANTDVEAEIADSSLNTLASTLLTAGSVVITAGVDPDTGVLTYTPPIDNSAATLIDQLILETDAAIGRLCNRYDSTGAQTFESASRTDLYDGNGQPKLVLNNAPVSTITSVSLVDSDGNTTAVTSYRADEKAGILYWESAGDAWFQMGYDHPSEVGTIARSGWPRGFQNIQVVYTAGYATVPADLRGLATDIVVEAYLNRRSNARLSADGVGGRSQSFKSVDELVRHRQAQLAPYKRHRGE